METGYHRARPNGRRPGLAGAAHAAGSGRDGDLGPPGSCVGGSLHAGPGARIGLEEESAMPERKRGFHALEERIHQLEEEHEKAERRAPPEQEEKEREGKPEEEPRKA